MDGKRALIFGASGQDGSYLTEHLELLGYQVFGTLRRHSEVEGQDARLTRTKIKTFYADVTDSISVMEAVKKSDPDEIYNLAAQSQVRISFDKPGYTVQTNGIGVLNVLEAMKMFAPKSRMYQASSSEMFGNSIDPDGFQREGTRMDPVSPYGVAKVMGYNLVRHYRRAYRMFCSNGILFNHSSVRRGLNFVEQKIARGVVEVSFGKVARLHFGNIDSKRDWGFAPDYVQAMRRILAHDEPDDFVIATGQSVSVREMLRYAASLAGIEKPLEEFVVCDEYYRRPEELNELRGDYGKAELLLGWAPQFDWQRVIEVLVRFWERWYGLSDRKVLQ